MIEIGMGTTLAPSTQEDIDWIEANYREGERMEQAVFGSPRTLLKDFESC